ncbi:hypothetical protein JVT61DRAFT_3439 [Boletus reticuloceps]|uniref:Uncharacterized protein n=1 Tax=Boletus reticuloceps TaxID=495285 RepID=A0A8I3A824_9AGAM|nr:hypothetical protein JVT61DRAFT_3439 [Boletus reticuloceps]
MGLGQDECACSHPERDHRVPEIPPRFCHGNRQLFATSDNPPTVRSNCTFCNQPYFVHPNDPTESNLPATTQTLSRGVPTSTLLSISAPATRANNRLLPAPSGNSPLSPLTASGGSSTSSANMSLQAYLHPIGSPLMSASATLPPLTQRLAPFPSWNPPGPPSAGSTNDRRLNRAAAARTRGVAASPFQSLTSGQHRQGSVQRVQSRRSLSSSRLPHGLSARKYVVVIHSEPAYGTIFTQSGSAFNVLRAPVPQKMMAFLDQAISLNLVFTFDCYAEDETPAGPQLDFAIRSHLSRYGFKFSQALPLDGAESVEFPRSLTRSIPSASSTPLVGDHTPSGSSEGDYEWNFLTSHKGQRKEAIGAKLTSSHKPAREITFFELDKIGSRVPRPPSPYQEFLLLFILPTGRNLVVGPLEGQGSSHLCLAMHLWNGFPTTSLL